jgi:hypothetical protein
MTVPYYGIETFNVLTGFSNYDLCYRFLNNTNNRIEKIELNELKYIASIMKIPIVIILKMNKDHKFDIYYSNKTYKDILTI